MGPVSAEEILEVFLHKQLDILRGCHYFTSEMSDVVRLAELWWLGCTHVGG
jgi:hypothetical protein